MELKEGYLLDYISGLPVKETPEEIDAVQPFSLILVDDYGYPKEYIQTRPQWRVKVRPSDSKKEYPVDIAVFSDSEHKDENIKIIVECKKRIGKMVAANLKIIYVFQGLIWEFGLMVKNDFTFKKLRKMA